MCLQEYHRDAVTCALPGWRAECSRTGCRIATRSQLCSQEGFCTTLLTSYFRLRFLGMIVRGPVVCCCQDGLCGVKLVRRLSLSAESRRVMPGRGRKDSLLLRAALLWRISIFLLSGVLRAP